MESVIDLLKSVQSNPLIVEEGEKSDIQILPSLKPQEISEFEELCDVKLSSDVWSLLRFSSGLKEDPLDSIDFLGEPISYIPNKPFAWGMREIAADGFGNFWFYWHIGENLGPVYFCDHEGPTIVYQSDSIFEFIEESINMIPPDSQSLVDDVHEYRIKKLSDMTDTIPYMKWLEANPTDNEFSSDDSDNPDIDLQIYDFRSAVPGDGIDLRKFKVINSHSMFPILLLERRKSILSKLRSLFSKF